MKKTTLSVIAKQANLSIASVSRVLKKPHLTSVTTQSKVYQAIEELKIDISCNLKPHSHFDKSNRILVLDNQFTPYTLINYGLEQTLRQAGFTVFYFRFPCQSKTDIHHLIQFINQNTFAGILVINDAPYLSELEQFKKALPPIVLINHFSRNFTCVYFDHLMIGYQITQYLLENAHQKIAILMNDNNKICSTLFLQGYQQALLRANIEFNPHYLVERCISYEHGRAAVKKLINSNNPPSAIICGDNSSLSYPEKNYHNLQCHLSGYHVVLGALHQAHESQAQLVRPLTITYVGHASARQYNELDKLSRINKPLYKMGQDSANLLCQHIDNAIKNVKSYHIIEAEPRFY